MAPQTEQTSDGCCGFFGLFGRVLKVVLPNVLPVFVAGIFRGQELEFCMCSDVLSVFYTRTQTEL